MACPGIAVGLFEKSGGQKLLELVENPSFWGSLEVRRERECSSCPKPRVPPIELQRKQFHAQMFPHRLEKLCGITL
jgi:hypothetical protein